MGWAKNNLSMGEREVIARQLFVAEDVDGDWINGLCPLHEDGNPSFGYNAKDDVYHCHAQCSKDGDLIDLYCQVYNLSAPEGFKEFRKKFSGADVPKSGTTPKTTAAKKPSQKKKQDDDSPAVDKKQMADTYESFPPLPQNWLDRLEEVRGWSESALSELGVRLQTHYRDKRTGTIKPVSEGYERVAIPLFDGFGVLQNIRLYRPKATENKIISWGKGVGENRLFPWPKKPWGEVWICEGEADTLCARSQGLDAYTQTAKRMTWPDEQIEPFRDCDVVIAYDADLPGSRYAKAAATSLARVARTVKVIEWPLYMMDGETDSLPEKHGQDLTDFFKKHNKCLADLRGLLADALDVKEDQQNSQAAAFFGITQSGRESFQPRLLADRLKRDFDIVWDEVTGIIYRWNGQYFEPFREGALKKRAIELLGLESTSGRYEDAVKQAVHLSGLPGSREMNDHVDLLCLRRGMFNVSELQMLPHSRDYYSSIYVDIDFDPKDVKDCPRWKKFLKETIQTQQVIEQFQEFFGLCLTRETRYEMCLIMIGDGGDGKSTAQKILRALVGAANCTSIGFDALEDQFQRSSLYNKMINLSSEVGNKAMDSEYFKKVISGDSINAAFKHKNAFDFVPFVKLVFAVNRMPKVVDSSDGLYRRLLPIWFKRQFLPGDPDRNPHLDDELMEELPGIFAWALQGLLRLRERGGFDMDCDETREQLMGYRRQNSPIFAFAEDCMVEGDAHEVSKESLYGAYKSYCGKNGFGAVHRENFFIEIKRVIKTMKNFRPTRDGKRIQMLRGAGLKADFTENSGS